MKSDATSRLRRLAAQAQQLQGVREQRGDQQSDVLADCFPEQRRFILDPSPFKAALCTRRAAKSYSFGLEAIHDSFTHPGSNYVFVGLTRESARRVFLKDVLEALDRKYGLGIRFNLTNLSATMPNGAVIYIVGCDSNEKEKRKLLGQRLRKVAIDEAQGWTTNLEELVLGTLKPALADERGSLSLLGTPGPLNRGFFARVTAGCTASKLSPPVLREPGWSLHCWTTFENPFVAPQWKEEIAELVAANPLIVETPFYRQNYLGEWIVDSDNLIYHFNPALNAWDGLLPVFADPRGSWHHVLGVDLGYSPDPSAFILCSYHDFQPTLYVRESWKQWQMDITDVANKIREFQSRFDLDALIIDGSAKQAVEEMRRRHDLPLIAAEKQEKAYFQALLDDDLRQAKVLIDVEACAGGLQNREVRGRGTVLESLSLVDELNGLILDPRALAKNKRVEHPACPNHISDALLYAWRHAYPYLASPMPPPRPKPGTAAWAAAEMERMFAAEVEEIEAKKLEEREGLGDSASWEDWAKSGR